MKIVRANSTLLCPIPIVRVEGLRSIASVIFRRNQTHVNLAVQICGQSIFVGDTTERGSESCRTAGRRNH